MKVSADGKKKWAILTEQPAALIPTAAELNAGIEASCVILDSDVNWSPTDSDTFKEKPSCVKGNVNAIGARNFDTALTFLLEWLAAGGADVTGENKAYEAVRVDGSIVWIYLRETDKDSPEPWAAEDVIFLGGKVISHPPQRVGNEGNLKRRIKFEAQDMIIEQKVGPTVP